MNRLLRSLADFCLRRPLAEKWLLAPDLRTGHAWLVTAAACGFPTANVRVLTLRAAAAELADRKLSELGLARLDRTGVEFLVGRALAGLSGRIESYLLSLNPTQALIRRFAASIEDLRLAAIAPAELRDGVFEDRIKARELRELLAAYEALLAGRYADYAGILRLATESIPGSGLFEGRDLYWLLPEDTRLAPLEEKFLAAFPQDRVIKLEVDRPHQAESGSGAESDARFPGRRLTSPLRIGMFRAVGEAGEVREVFRRILARGCRLDEVELVHTDRSAYVPLVVELLQALLPGEPLGPDKLPVAFAEGIPAGLSRPGRALAGWLAWISADCPQLGLVRLVEDGLIRIEGEDGERFGYPYLASLLVRPAIGLGLDRYEDAIRRWLASLENRRRAAAGEAGDEEAGARPPEERDVEAGRLLQEAVAGLVKIHPPALETDARRRLECVREFIERFARRLTEFDEYARRALVEAIDNLIDWVGREGPPRFDLAGLLAGLGGEVRVMGAGPLPGKLYVSPVHNGGHSGRPLTFVVGLDDSRCPGPRSQDPLLLDAEREKLSTALVTSHGRLARTLEEFGRLAARLRGEAVFSWAGFDLAEDREVFPSPVLLPLCRQASANDRADLKQMLDWAGPPVSFAPELPVNAVSETEWWLASLCGGSPDAALAAAVPARFPHLGRGSLAEAARAGEEFTGFDGLIGRVERPQNPLDETGPVVSGSKLECLGACPLRYFYRYLLNLEPPEEPEIDPSLWLDPKAAGSLLHELFHDFLAGLIGAGELPETSRLHQERLDKLLGEKVNKFSRRFPVAGQGALRRRLCLLQDTARVFLAEEAENWRLRRPVWLEASVGLPPADPPTGIDSPEALRVRLADGSSVALRGRIDRIDRENGPAENYSVTDYKTGASSPYSLKNPFDRGRRMQPVVYLELARRRITELVGPRARVTGFSYFFPGRKDRGLRLGWPAGELEEGWRILALLVRQAASGAFPSTDDKNDCRFCDYQLLCGSDLERVAGNCRRKLDNQSNRALETFRELRRGA